jgi:hypothetical protein
MFSFPSTVFNSPSKRETLAPRAGTGDIHQDSFDPGSTRAWVDDPITIDEIVATVRDLDYFKLHVLEQRARLPPKLGGRRH